MLELSATASHACGRALFDAKELCLEQGLDDGRTIHGDKRPVPSPAQLVYLSSDELLASPTLAFHQHGEIRRGHTLYAFAQRVHNHRRTNQRCHADRRPGASRRTAAPDFHDESTNLRDGVEHVEIVFVEATA